MPATGLTLFVETPSGTWIRRITPASVLRGDIPQGYAAEEATRGAAARWGIPDFVFKSVIAETASGQREVGDVLVVAGDLAACVEVKTRVKPTGNADRERNWLDKKIEQGLRQATGSRRKIGQLGVISAINERGSEVNIDAAHLQWVDLLIVDHPGIDDYVPREASALVILRRDWEFLFSQLKSTYAVLEYLLHISRSDDRIALGDEPARYYRVALASQNKPPDPMDDRLGTRNVISAPLFPLEPAPYGEIIRWVLEDIGALPALSADRRNQILSVLAAVDSVPVAFRKELGSQILAWFAEVAASPPNGTMWRSRRIVSGTRDHVLFTVCSRAWEPELQDMFSSLVQLRHEEHRERTPERHDLKTVGILLTPRVPGWHTTIVATTGEQDLAPEVRSAMEKLWGTWDSPGTNLNSPANASPA